MCKFFSAISNGNGKTLFFTIEQVCGEMAKGNPKEYDWNSHTSIADFNGIKGADEDKWNKWEYDVDKKILEVDQINTKNDKNAVEKAVKDYLESLDIGFVRNLYNRNSGNWNSGDWNSGDWNSGNWNSGNGNSGDRNSGNRNSGDWNSGNRNSGNGNSGNRNSGDWNSGDWNSGNWNSGDGNSGDRNSGDGNSGNGTLNSFCTERQYILFNKKCTKDQYDALYSLTWSWFILTEWINESSMTEEEKTSHPEAHVQGGYLKTYSYKEAWSKCPDKFKEDVKKLKNFDKKLFKEISGLDI